MAHPYQSKFTYRPRKNSPVPTPFGEYLRGRTSGLGAYTLGSLSNKPGRDWATPRYVRDEPDMFMSGFGEGEEYERDDGTVELDREAVQQEIERQDEEVGIDTGGPTTQEKIDAWMAANPAIVNAVKTVGMTGAQLGLALLNGGGSVNIPGVGAIKVGGSSTPPPVNPEYDPGLYYPPVPVVPSYENAVPLTTWSASAWKAGLGPQYTAQVAKQKNQTLLLVGAAVVAFLLLSK